MSLYIEGAKKELNIIKSMKRSNVIKEGEWFCAVAAGR